MFRVPQVQTLMARIPDEIVDQVKDRSDIVEIVSGYVTLKKAGKDFKALSPFNSEKTPSFIVSPQKQIFKCFSSGIGGNVFTFIMNMERLEFPEAVRFLARKCGIEVPEDREYDDGATKVRDQIFGANNQAAQYYHEQLLHDASPAAARARDYLKNRGVTLETVKNFRLGFAPDSWDSLIRHMQNRNVTLRVLEQAGLIKARQNKEGFYDGFRNRIIFPITDTQGRVRAFGARALADDGAKYINSPETAVYTKGEHVYGFELAKATVTQEDFVVIVEGYMDCVMPHQAGFANIVASLGTALTQQQVRNIRRFTHNVVMLYDNDKAGEAAMIRSFDMLIEEGMNVRVASLEAGDDPDSFVRKNGVEEFQTRIAAAVDLFDYKLSKLCQRFDPATVQGKAKICDEMIPTIDRYPHAVKQAGYIQQLAAKIGISEKVLNVELTKHREGIRRPAAPVEVREPLPEPSAPPRTVECSLLKLLLEEQAYIATTRAELSAEDFQDRKVRAVIDKIYEIADQGREVQSSDLVNRFEDQDIVRLIARLATDDQLIAGDKDKIHRDCVTRLKQDRIKSHRKELIEKMKQAQEAGDTEALERLKQEFYQSIKN